MKKINKHISEKYINSAIVQKEIIARLIERLSFINFIPRRVIDLGSGVGLSTKSLLEIYPNAELIMIDHSSESLSDRILDNKNLSSVCANFKNIPFENSSFDFVFSSSALHWELDIQSSFKEIYRILKPGGLFLFSTYGPDTLIELRSAWAQIDSQKHVNDFYDMHDIGDLMQSLNFMDSVLDTEKIIIQYENVIQLQKDLKNIGSKVFHENTSKVPLLGNQRMRAMYQEYEKFRTKFGYLPATYEVIYGSAWKKMDNILEYSK